MGPHVVRIGVLDQILVCGSAGPAPGSRTLDLVDAHVDEHGTVLAQGGGHEVEHHSLKPS